MAYDNNNNIKRLVSTIGNQFYGQGMDGGDKSLSLGFLENSLSVGIYSTLSNPTSQGQKYDYKSGNILYLPAKKAKAFARLVNKVRNQIIEGSDVDELSVSSSTNLIEVSDGTKFGMQPGVTIAIYNNMNENKVSESFATFQFRNEDIITGYDYKSGTYDKSNLDADVDYFIDYLKEFSKAATNSFAHFNKKDMTFTITNVVNRQRQIMQALGIQMETPSSVRGNFNYNNGGGYNNSNGSTKTYNTEALLQELDSLA